MRIVRDWIPEMKGRMRQGGGGGCTGADRGPGKIVKVVVVVRKNRNGFRAAYPIGKLSIGPAAEGKDGGAGDVDLSTRHSFPAVLKHFLRMIGVSIWILLVRYGVEY